MGLLDIASLQPGMILSRDVLAANFKIPLACQGVKVTQDLIRKLSYLGVNVVNIEIPTEVARQIIRESTDVLQDIFETIGNTRDANFNKLVPTAEKIAGLISQYGPQVIDEIFLLWNMDQYTFHHSIGTAFFSALIGVELNYKKDELQDLVLGSLVHDLGKGLIPASILNKPGKLTPHEFEEVKKHSYIGYNLLKEHSNFNENVLAIPLQHHERKDGNGYPLMLKEGAIHPYAKVVSIADTFSALTTNRVYREKVSKFVAGEYLISSAKYALDSYIVNIFLFSILKGMKDTWVQLSNGEIGRVTSVNYKFPTRPKVAIYNGDSFVKERNLVDFPEIYLKEYLYK